MDDDEYEFEDELDEVDYDAFPTPDSLETENGDQWRQVVGSPSETGTRAFRPARDVLSQAVAYEGDDYSSDWMEEDTALSSSAGDMTEGSDDPTSEELSSNNGDRVQDDGTQSGRCSVNMANGLAYRYRNIRRRRTGVTRRG